MASRQRQGKRSFLFLALSTLLVLMGGMLTLLGGPRENSRADAGYVVGPPTLAAATVNQIFARVGSPLAGSGAAVEQAARHANIDDAFALAVWWTETNDGTAGVGRADRNPGSVRGTTGYPAAFDGYTIYPSYTAAINDWFTLLRNRYVNRGLTSAYTISYSYVGASGAASWAARVVNLMLRYHGEAPIAGAPLALAVAHPNIPQTPANKGHAHSLVVRQTTVQGLQRPVDPGREGSGHPARRVSRTRSAAEHTHEIFTAHVQQVLIVLVLLAIILAMLPSIHLRRRERGAQQGRPLATTNGRMLWARGELRTGPLLPLSVKAYSPVMLGQEEPATRVTEALRRDVVAVGVTGVTGVPATPVLSRAGTVPLTPFIAASRARHGAGGGRGELPLRRARLVPVESRRSGEPATEGMQSVSGKPGRSPAGK